MKNGKSHLDFLFIYPATGLSPIGMPRLAPPLGLMQMASYLKLHGFNASVIDTRQSRFTLDWLKSHLERTRPRWIGIPAYTDILHNTKRLIKSIRKFSPVSKIVCGASHATICDKEVMENLEPDVVVRGDGEIPCLDLLSKKRLSDVHGITYRRAGKLMQTENARLLDLDELPLLDYGLLDGSLGTEYLASILTTVGCPYRCTFCAAAVLSPCVRMRNINKVIGDIKSVLNYTGERFFALADDTFTLDVGRVMDFCRKIKKIGGGKKIFWYAEGRVDRLAKNLWLVKEMYDAGLRFLQFGIESGDRKVLKAYRKQISLGDAEKLISTCADNRILMHTNFMFGGPFESDKTIENTRNFAMRIAELSRGYLQISQPYLSPYPGTDIFKSPSKYGLTVIDPDYSRRMGFDHCITETLDLSREEIIWHRQKFRWDMTEMLLEIIKSQDNKFHDYCAGVAKETGMGVFHFSIFANTFGDRINYFELEYKLTLDGVGILPQFHFTAGTQVENSIPVRTTSLSVSEKGLFDSPLFKGTLSPQESKTIDFCSGKIAAEEIARRTELGMTQLKQILSSLEKKGAIVYRSY